MRALLVNPLFPETYWSQCHALPFVRRRCLLPPLGLITVAAMLPRSWELELVDLNVEPLSDGQIQAADVVMLTGMLAQYPSVHDVLARCRRLGVRSIIGGPYATSLPERLADADHIVIGEVEELLDDLVADLEAGRAGRVYREGDKPDLSRAPVPRYDLLRTGAYHHMSLQFSRGCPFACEFCDVVAMFGRRPRTKSSTQVMAELESIRKTGFCGDVFFVDDNFIGNKRLVRQLLPQIADWRQQTRAPLTFYTEASINLSRDEALADEMVRAGFTAAFVGIETPSESALKESGKLQNAGLDLVGSVHRLLRQGLDVWGGFILGFDEEGDDIFDRMIRFVQQSAIPYAMVGLLQAMPNTPLYRRMEREGRLQGLPVVRGDQFGCTNFLTRLDPRTMLDGYKHVLESLYSPSVYFERCIRNLEKWIPSRSSRRRYTIAELSGAFRSLIGQGKSSGYRKSYREFIRWVLTHQPSKLGKALAQAIVGHHLITYTWETVLPSLERRIADLSTGPALGLAPVVFRDEPAVLTSDRPAGRPSAST
ncbi:MAG: B12-binding domain-containing radical SAM protein [Acidobacteriota bacterium]|nr:MAG: B12-binding domain-containing radical SAM protein [Acidobacteriota bacterium]